jgi:hypothetical protein
MWKNIEAKPRFAISLEKKKTCLPALKNFPMLRETNNQFYMALGDNCIVFENFMACLLAPLTRLQ